MLYLWQKTRSYMLEKVLIRLWCTVVLKTGFTFFKSSYETYDSDVVFNGAIVEEYPQTRNTR